MVLADTSVWIAHFRKGDPLLEDLLAEGMVLMHPFISGELALGNLKNRTAILEDLGTLPVATHAADSEVMQLIEERKLWGRGLGWVDAHLLGAALLSGCRLWTLDKRLANAAAHLGLR